MSRRIQSVLAGLLTIFSVVVLAVPASFAATDTQASNDGMKVSPVRTDVIMSPGQTKTVTVTIQNVTKNDGSYSVITNDFQAKDETGAPSLLLNGSLNAQHGLKQYMSVPKTVAVAAGEQKDVAVTVTLPLNIAGGGYYGAVRFAPAGGSNGGANVSLSGSVASLILVSVPGNVNENLQIASFSATHGTHSGSFFTNNKNLSATVRFRNAGNVQEQPFGKILLKKGDKTLNSYEINNSDPRGNVLPDSIRRFDVPLKGVGSFGKYTLVGNFGYSSKGQLVSASTSFYVVPLALVIVAIVIILLLLALLVGGPRAIKRYNQRVLRRAGRR
jgi:hypothetical protein